MPWLDDEQFPEQKAVMLPSTKRQWQEAFVAIAIGLVGGVTMFLGLMWVYSLGGL